MNRATRDLSQRKTAGRRRARPDGRIVAVGVVAMLAALWMTYWYGASQIGAAVLDRVAAAAAERGYTARCADIAGGGFPLSVDLTCSRAGLAGADGLQAAVDGFSATTTLLRPLTMRSTAVGPLTVSLPASASDVTARWQKAEARIDAGFGGLSGIATRLEDLRLELPVGVEAPSFERLSLALGEVSVSPASEDDYHLSALARGIALQAKSDRNLPEIDIDAELIALDFGDSLGLDPRRALGAWIDSGGGLRIDDLTIVADTVSVKASGTLVLSADGKFSGDIDVTIAGIELLPDLVESFYPQARDQTRQIVAAVVAFTRPANTPSGPARRMTLLVRDSVVSIGILPIGVIPTLTF